MTKRRIPTKNELLQLQKMYKTDERIGERLGGIPAYLVGYWRRKKNIPKYSLPKFSELEIKNLWERFGDDEKAGLELGISKAAFYNWRRRYGLREKPSFLKLEQLELNFPGLRNNTNTSSLYNNRTVVQKILARASGNEHVMPGESIEISPDILLVHRSIPEVIKSFKSEGSEYVHNPSHIVLTFGPHDKREYGNGHHQINDFIKRQHIKNVYDNRHGPSPLVLIEGGHILSGHLALTTSGNSFAYGSLGCMSINIDASSMGKIWATGKHRIKVPAASRVTISGKRYRGVFATDIALHVIGQLKANNLKESTTIEYSGSIVSQFTINERITISSLSSCTGAGAALCPYDATTRRYLLGRISSRPLPVIPDKNAEYLSEYEIDLDHLQPQLLTPGNGRSIRPVTELEGKPINEIIIGTGNSGRFDELRVAAHILKGRKVHDDCRLYIIPASRQTYLEALKKGLIRVFIEAGAIVMHPGEPDLCSDINVSVTAGKRCLITGGIESVSTKNNPKQNAYVASAATAAASALQCEITDPTRFLK